MRALRWAVVVMGVLIVAGTVTLVTLVVVRANNAAGGGTAGGGTTAATSAVAAPSQVALDEPPGTRVIGASLSGAGDRVLVRLEGGGPDRMAVVDLRTGRVLSRIGLSR